jgi:hypothetical protein
MKLPLDIFMQSIKRMNKNLIQLEPANKQLVGKIKDEHSLFYDGDDESKMKRHNDYLERFKLVYGMFTIII